MFAVILVEPEIPPNTGNIIRLCANTGAQLHLIRPMGFELDNSRMKRAGLDYHEFARVFRHADWTACLSALTGRRLFAVTTSGGQRFDTPAFQADDAFVFGNETSGLPPAVMSGFTQAQRLRLPMRVGQRSLNLSNAVAVMVFEAWRQLGYNDGV